MTTEPPKGLKANLVRLLQNTSEDRNMVKRVLVIVYCPLLAWYMFQFFQVHMHCSTVHSRSPRRNLSSSTPQSVAVVHKFKHLPFSEPFERSAYTVCCLFKIAPLASTGVLQSRKGGPKIPTLVLLLVLVPCSSSWAQEVQDAGVEYWLWLQWFWLWHLSKAQSIALHSLKRLRLKESSTQSCLTLQVRTSWPCTWMRTRLKFHGMPFDTWLLRPLERPWLVCQTVVVSRCFRRFQVCWSSHSYNLFHSKHGRQDFFDLLFYFDFVRYSDQSRISDSLLPSSRVLHGSTAFLSWDVTKKCVRRQTMEVGWLNIQTIVFWGAIRGVRKQRLCDPWGWNGLRCCMRTCISLGVSNCSWGTGHMWTNSSAQQLCNQSSSSHRWLLTTSQRTKTEGDRERAGNIVFHIMSRFCPPFTSYWGWKANIALDIRACGSSIVNTWFQALLWLIVIDRVKYVQS